jgi:hypothetical protein
MRYLRARLREASSWAGFSAVLGVLGSQLPAPHGMQAYIASAVAGAIAVLLRDPGSPDAQNP